VEERVSLDLCNASRQAHLLHIGLTVIVRDNIILSILKTFSPDVCFSRNINCEVAKGREKRAMISNSFLRIVPLCAAELRLMISG